MILKSSLDSVLGKHVPAGVERRYNCPFCALTTHGSDTKQHLYVNLEKGVYFCFRCDAKGPLRKLFSFLNLEPPENGEVESLSSLGQVISNLSTSLVLGSHNQPKLDFPCDVCNAWDSVEARTYLRLRGLDEITCLDYSLKFGVLVNVPRVFLPVYRPGTRELIYWTGRKFHPSDEGNPKILRYTTPKGVSKNLLYGLDVALREVPSRERVIITEGPFSAIAAGREAVATLGKNFTKFQVDLLEKSGFSEYIVAFDGDAHRSSIELCKSLVLLGLSVSLVRLPDGHDPASVDDFSSYLSARVPINLSKLCALSVGGYDAI